MVDTIRVDHHHPTADNATRQAGVAQRSAGRSFVRFVWSTDCTTSPFDEISVRRDEPPRTGPAVGQAGGMTRRVAKVAFLAVAASVVAAYAGNPAPRSRPLVSPEPEAAEAPPPSPETLPPTSVMVPTATLAVRLHDYAIQPAVLQSVAGVVTIETVNDDGVPHDVTLLRTARARDALPTTGIRVAEDDPSIEIVGRTPRLGGGGTSSVTMSLEPGTYVLVCTVPHHYVREAMVATLTVTG